MIIVTGLLVACSSSPQNPPKTMPQVNLQHYMGTWHEIASFPAPFQKNCYCTTTRYQLQGKKVNVINSCRKDSTTGDIKTAHATAVAIANSGNSKLKITFFWPFKANYWILYVSPDYQTAVVGTPNHRYLWILARNKTISQTTYKQLIHIAQQRGYNIKDLHKTPQCLATI